MVNAHILGDQQGTGELDQKPTIWEPLFQDHSTSVSHPQPLPFAIGNSNVDFSSDEISNLSNFEKPQIQGRQGNGPIVTGVNAQADDSGNTSFIHINDKEKLGTIVNNISDFKFKEKDINLDTTTIIGSDGKPQASEQVYGTPVDVADSTMMRTAPIVSSHDMDYLDSLDPSLTDYPQKLYVGNSKEETIRNLKEAKERLMRENDELKVKVKVDLDDIAFCKEIADRMSKQLSRYEDFIKQKKVGRLTDIQANDVKAQFKRYALNNLEGFRNSIYDFPALKSISTAELRELFHKLQAAVIKKD
jgi:hypothetical protein